MTGAQYFASQLAANNGNFFQTLGQYNGWEVGMTTVSVFFLIDLIFCGAEEDSRRTTPLVCATPLAARRTTLTSRCSSLATQP
jgi:hypothetical protein